MRRVVGLARDELETRERVFDGLVMKSLRRSLRAVAGVDGPLAAATTPTLSTNPSEPNPTLPAGALGVVTTTWSEQVDAELFPYLVQTFVDAADELAPQLPPGTPKITYDLAATYLLSAANRLKGIGDAVWSDVRAQLAAGYQAGESIEQLAARLRAVAKISEPRALTIARTEVIPAANFGSLQQLKAAGFADDECQKEWLATNDARTREAHRLADGQRVGLSQPFQVDGDFLQVPGDPAGRAENVINCRCTVAYVFDDDDDFDETPLVADAAFEKLHPRDDDGQFTAKSPFTILPESRRGKSGDRMYAPGMWGRYGGAGIMMRHVGADGVSRYMVVQRSTGGYNKWRWQLPGGARDQLETAEQAAAREANEEIGFTQEQLDTLTPRGAHVVSLPVEGKDPWTYSSVVADAPEAFKPKIDYSELGAARWLTYAQLVEMRGRGRLIAPFAAQLEDIIARFDEPQVASFIVIDMTTSDDREGYYDLMTAAKWTAADEAKHKRDSEGKFAKKAGASLLAQAQAAKTGEIVAVGSGSTAGRRIRKSGSGFYADRQNAHGQWVTITKKMNVQQLENYLETGTWDAPSGPNVVYPQVKKTLPTAAQPLHVNTAVIYKKGGHKHGEVIAVKPGGSGGSGIPERLVWNEKVKRFELQGRHSDGTWGAFELYTKKAAYDKFSKDTDWQKPGVGTVLVPMEHMLPTPTPTPTPKKPPTEKPKTVDEMTPKQFADWFGDKYTAPGLTAGEVLWNALTTDEQLKIVDKANDAKKVGLPGPANVIALWAGVAAPIVVKEMKEVDPQLGKPIHINTTAIYKTKYADGTVIAEKVSDDGQKKLTWNAKTKKFDLHSRLDASVPWQHTGSFNKGEAYQKFSKQTGWTHPTTQAHAVGAPAAVKVPDFMSDPPHVIAGFYANLTQDDYDALSTSDQILIQGEAPFYDAMAPFGQKYSDKLAGFLSGKGATTTTSAPSGSASGGGLPDFDSMTYSEAVVWFSDLTQDDYNALSTADKKKLYVEATKLSESFPSSTGDDTLFDTVMSDLVSSFTANESTLDALSFDDFDDVSGPDGTAPVYYKGSTIAWAKSADDGSGAFLFKVAPDGGKGAYVGAASFEDGETVLGTVNGLLGDKILKPTDAVATGGGTPTSLLGPKSSGFDVDDFLLQDSLAQTAIINSLTSDDVDKLTPIEYSDVAAQAAALKKVGFLSKAEFDAFQAKGSISTSTPISAPVAAPSPPASTFASDASPSHVEVHGKIKFVGDLGVPTTPSKSSKFETLTPGQAQSLQNTMLAASGKTWSKPETDAIKRYGTSVGYRSTNAVLRDDKKQLKLLSGQQVKDGVKNAVELQNAMTPLPQNVKLFRGTGAHAFGQSTISANFDELKKLEGQTLTDKGFMSTTVDEKKTVSYDYAKKPIQVVVSAPAGTPAVYADAAIPGHSEHEIILGAGTSYRVDAVRQATAEDRARYGNSSLEHVVEVTVVPSTSNASTPLGAPPAKPSPAVAPAPLVPAAPSAAVAPTLGPIQASDLKKPMKITTTVIYKQKYQHGAVVAYRKDVGGLARLVWSATTKKFILQKQNPADGTWVNFTGHGKGDAYQEFGKNVSAPWYAPPPGDSAIGSGGVFGLAPKNVSAPSGASTPASTPAQKPSKFDAAELQKLHGQIPAALAATTKRDLFNDFKKNSSLGFVQLSSNEATIFTALKETLDRFDEKIKNGTADPASKLNMLQLIKIIDEESTNKANALAAKEGKPANLTNAQLYEKKLVAWLQTSAGATYATDKLYPTPVVFDTSGPVNPYKTYKSSNYTPAVVDRLNKIKDPATIGTPDVSATTFKTLKNSEALALQAQQLANAPWKPSEKSAIRKYSGDYYKTMNPVVRDLAKDTKWMAESTLLQAASTAVSVQNGMRPLPQSVKVFRRTEASQFPGLTNSASFDDVKKFEGKLFIDRAPMSTSISPGTWSGKVHFEIDLPAGTPAIYIANVSAHPHENEMLLALGLKYRVLSVKSEFGVTKVHMRVEA